MSTRNSCAKHCIQNHFEPSRPYSIPKRSDISYCVTSQEDTVTSKPTPEERRVDFATKRSKSFKSLFLNNKNSDPNSNNIEKPSQPSTKSKFSSLVTKHILPIKFLSSLKQDPKKNFPPNVSCPDLNRPYTPVDSSVRPKSANYLSEIKLQNKVPRPSEQSSSQVSPNLLSPAPKSPKNEFLFTTSFTHSLPKEKCKSVQELENNLTVFKQALKRSYSDQPNIGKSHSPSLPLRAERPRSSNLSLHNRPRSNLSLHISACLQSKMYRNEFVSQLLDYLYIGSVESAYNEPLLCKLKIDSLVDMSNMSASQVPSGKKLHCPCLCGNEARHFRSRLVIRIDDKETEDIEQYFDEINKFIDSSKRCGRRVLIFSYHGNSRAPVAAIQYMMSQEEFLLRQAYNLVKNQRPSVEINQGFQNTLEALEQRVFPDAKPSVSFGNDYLNIADPQAIKCAWIDCDT